MNNGAKSRARKPRPINVKLPELEMAALDFVRNDSNTRSVAGHYVRN